MGGAVRAITKPFEQIFQGVGSVITPKMPDIPAPPPAPDPPPAEPAGPGASASESSSAQDERNRLLASLSRKKTKTLLTGSQGLTSAAGAVRKKLLGE